MQSDLPQSQPPVSDETYLKIWEVEQAHANMRWTVITFFMSVSFAIFGFSFQEKLPLLEALTLRLAGLLVYWFAFMLLLHFYRFTRFLRSYLFTMENAQQTSLDLQSKAIEAHIAEKPFSTTRLILGLGVIYTLGVFLLLRLGL